MKLNVTHSCGHNRSVSLDMRMARDRSRREKLISPETAGLCPDCAARERDAACKFLASYMNRDSLADLLLAVAKSSGTASSIIRKRYADMAAGTIVPGKG